MYWWYTLFKCLNNYSNTSSKNKKENIGDHGDNISWRVNPEQALVTEWQQDNGFRKAVRVVKLFWGKIKGSLKKYVDNNNVL